MRKIKIEFSQFLEQDNRDFILRNDEGITSNFATTNLPVVQVQTENFYPPVLAQSDLKYPNRWIPTTTFQEKDTENIEVAKNYLETPNGVFSVKDEEPHKKILNAKLRIVAVINEIDDDKVQETFLKCQIQRVESVPLVIIVPKEKFQDVFREIQKKFPEFFLSELTSDAVREYLSDVYRRDIDNAPVEIVFQKIGWHNYAENLSYEIGKDEFYKTMQIPLVNVSEQNLVFNRAWKFLEIGKNGEQISAIWLMAHIALTNYFFRLAGHPFSSVLYVGGATNLLKTSVVKVVANVFDSNRDNATLRMTSTSASIVHILNILRDILAVVDDFSSTELKSKNQALENAENVIRAVGDGIFPTKMNPQNFSKPVQESVRCSVILTGEEALNLGTSSHYRVVEISVEEGTFDGKILREFQDDPSIMAKYFAVYLDYLTQNGLKISEYSKQTFTNYRKYFEEKFSIPRFVETAAILQIQIDILSNFARYCRQDENFISYHFQILSQNLIEIMEKNKNSGMTLKPTLKFLKALWQILDTTTNNKIADDEESYIVSEEKFIGFREMKKNLLWIRPDEAYKIVTNFYKNRAENFLTTWDTLKKDLLREGFSEGVFSANGTSEYLKRAKKGSRKRMLVLRIDIVEKSLENLKGDF